MRQENVRKIPSFERSGVFIRDNDAEIILLKNYRDFIQPGWANALEGSTNQIPSKKNIVHSTQKVERVVDDLLSRLRTMGFEIQNKDVLEFGCNNGSKLFHLSALKPKSLVGSDLLEFYRSGTNEQTSS